jgi:hypothetical protein
MPTTAVIAAAVPAATTAVIAAATAMPFGVRRRRRQQTSGDRRRDQECFEAHHRLCSLNLVRLKRNVHTDRGRIAANRRWFDDFCVTSTGAGITSSAAPLPC